MFIGLKKLRMTLDNLRLFGLVFGLSKQIFDLESGNIVNIL